MDQYWVVIDKDETPPEDFSIAIQLAEVNGIQVAWSNQAFECWIILHYRDFRHSCHRKDYENLLKQHISWYDSSEKGEEQGRKLFRQTFPAIQVAIKNTKNGFESFDTALSESQRESSTKVYDLVESILKNS